MWGPDHSDDALETVRGSGLSYVIIRTGKLRSRIRKTVPMEAVAEAIDAADDLAGEVRVEVDLTRRDGWGALQMEPPS
jgi:hypothetical protein